MAALILKNTPSRTNNKKRKLGEVVTKCNATRNESNKRAKIVSSSSRRVRFSTKNQTILRNSNNIENEHEYSAAQELWYTRKEYSSLSEELRLIMLSFCIYQNQLRQEENEENKKEILCAMMTMLDNCCTRGLERYLEDANVRNEKENQKKSVKQIIIVNSKLERQQKEQKNKLTSRAKVVEAFDSEAIREMYSLSATISQQRALDLAAQDTIEAFQIHHGEEYAASLC